jgi:hypothetical protein
VSRTIFVALLVAACGGGGDSTLIGGPCDAESQCDDDQVCDLTAQGGAVCLAKDGDADGDGIPNAQDRCQHLAGGKFDEDNDGLGDECDPCPIDKNNSDPDGDGIAGSCDPRPNTAGDKLLVFNGFNEDLPAKDWSKTAGWKIQGGEAIVTPSGPATEDQILAGVNSTNRFAVLAGYRADSVATGATEPIAAVIVIDKRPAGLSRAICGGARVGADNFVRAVSNIGDQVDSQVTGITNAFDAAALYQVAAQIEGANVGCALLTNGAAKATSVMSDGSAFPQVGLFARGATIRFPYLYIVGH